MAWPIPYIPQKKPIPMPKYKLWGMLLILMLTVGVILSLWLWNFESYARVFFYGPFPAFLVWLCLFGVALNRYEQSAIASQSWNRETEQTKAKWRDWSRRQLAVIGNVFFSPEEKGMEALLGELDKVPAYPKKARRLFGSPYSLSELMKQIDQKLEQQSPGYRYLLHSVYVLQSSERFEVKSDEAIYQQWDLMPEYLQSVESIQTFHDLDNFEGLILIICLQDWTTHSIAHSSEFISAQLIASSSFALQHALPVVAGLNRMMPLEPGQLVSELDMLFEYNQPDRNKLEYVWLCGAAAKTSTEIMQYATQHHWPLPDKRPLYSIDHSFGPPGDLAVPLALAMLVEAAKITSKDQLLISQTLLQTGTLCLITRELYA